MGLSGELNYRCKSPNPVLGIMIFFSGLLSAQGHTASKQEKNICISKPKSLKGRGKSEKESFLSAKLGTVTILCISTFSVSGIIPRIQWALNECLLDDGVEEGTNKASHPHPNCFEVLLWRGDPLGFIGMEKVAGWSTGWTGVPGRPSPQPGRILGWVRLG